MAKELITVKHLQKFFDISFKRRKTSLGRIVDFLSFGAHSKKVHVLKDINFSVKAGEILGVVGSNGSGKSTLLRILAGIYDYDSGYVVTKGHVISLLGMGLGFYSQLSIKENIYIFGTVMGLSRAQITRRYDDIVSFADLQKFTDVPLYTYSSGMIQRLAFSIAIHTDPDILLLDEVFEVGDDHFRKKSALKIQSLVKSGACVVLVSHNYDLISKYCTRALWIEKGSVKGEGLVSEVLNKYTV